MNTVSLGKSSLECTRLAYGCWRIAGTWEPSQVTPAREEHGRRAVIAAYEAGYTLFDHADIYCHGKAESIFGQVLKEVSGMRQNILIATKCGIRRQGDPDASAPYRYDFSEEHIVKACERSLERLGVEFVDLFMLHRPDYLADPEEVASAFTRLKKQGKVREFGVSNFRPSQLSLLQQACPMPLIANQVSISLACLNSFNDGTLDQCLVDHITPMAWSPLAGGALASTAAVDLRDQDHARRAQLKDVLKSIARSREAASHVIALAWLLKHPAGIVPILGSTDPTRIKDATGAPDLELTREEWYKLMEAAHGQRLP